jgi:hypothetical protein
MPDILYVAPINNDVGNDATYNSTTRTAAYTSYFTTIRAALPNCIIVCGGGYATGALNLTTDAASAYQVDLDMQAAITAFADPLIFFTPSISDVAGRWLYGDGDVGTTGNSTPGNTNRMIGDGSGDALHPNQRALDYLQWKDYGAIVSAIQTLLP